MKTVEDASEQYKCDAPQVDDMTVIGLTALCRIGRAQS